MKKVYNCIVPRVDLLNYVRLVAYGTAYIETYKFNVIDVKEETTYNKNSGQRSFILTIICEDKITDEEVKEKKA